LTSSANAASWVRAKLGAYRAQLRFCLRLTVAAVLAFAVSHLFHFPLSGLWSVLTAVVVTQMSVGGSLQATTEYVLGTVGGAVYATLVAVLVPHTTPLELAGVLALTLAPVAFLAVLRPTFRVAPFTAVIVLLVSSELDQGPVASAVYRVLEVAAGGASAILVSLLILPERAHGLGLGAAARALDQLADALPELLAGVARALDSTALRLIHDKIGRAVAEFQEIARHADRERLAYLGSPDPGPLSRTLLRLRHDLVILGRAAREPLPGPFPDRLGPALARVGECASDYLRQCAAALLSDRPPPPLDRMEAALDAYEAEIAAIRREGATRALASNDLERLFALGFALEQLYRDLQDLERCVKDFAPSAAAAPKQPEK